MSHADPFAPSFNRFRSQSPALSGAAGVVAKFSLALGLALGSPALWAQTTATTWGGAGSSTTTSAWGTATNWSNGVPTITSPAKYAAFDGHGASTVTAASGNAVKMTFSASAGNYTITTGSSKLIIGSGGITIDAGTQTFNGAQPLNPSASQTWSVATGAAMNVETAIFSNGALTLSGAGNFTISGNISTVLSTYTFTKSGSGTAILGGTANTLTAPMTVSDGTLLINGTFSATTGAMTVNGGTLGGTGTMNKPTTINSGGTLAPGASAGVLTFGSALTLASGSTTAFELNGTTRGTGYDGINLTSTTSLLTYGGLLSLNFGTTFLEGADLNLFDLPTTGVGAVPAGAFNAITGTGNYAGSFTDTGGGIWTMTSGAQLLTFTQSTGNLTFSAASAIPEPTTYVALAGALGLAFAVWRRGGKRQQALVRAE